MNLFDNIVFISAEQNSLDKHTNYERTGMLRTELIKLGLAFDGVTEVDRNGKSRTSFLVVTNKLEQMKKLAKDFKQDTILISDNRRTTFVVSLGEEKPTNLGTLRRVSKEVAVKSGNFFFIVKDNGSEYYYSAQE